MKVAHIVNGEVVRGEVPLDWIKCSVSGEYRPHQEFRNEDQHYQSRTNCTRTYMMSSAEMQALSKQTAAQQSKVRYLEQQMYREAQDDVAGVSVADLIAELQRLQAANPNARIVVSEDGDWTSTIVDKVSGYNNLYTLI